MEGEQALRQRRNRNIALAVSLTALAVLVFVMSIVKWGGHLFH